MISVVLLVTQNWAAQAPSAVHGGLSEMDQHTSYRFGILVTVMLMLTTGCCQIPYRCATDFNLIISCACEASIVNGTLDILKVTLNCRNTNLTTVPQVHGASNYDVYELTLNNNNIKTILSSAFNGLRIQRLDLLNNRLTSIAADAFKGLETYLLELRISSDKGSSVQFNVPLTNFTALTLLHLENFMFADNKLNLTWLKALTGLRTLLLINNGITYIYPDAIPASLTSFTLAGQNLLSLPLDNLRVLTALKYLTITGASITNIIQRAFIYNTQLQSLDLSNNKLITLDPGCFSGINGSLRQLILRNNNVNINELVNLAALESLDLSYTQLQSLPPNAIFLKNKVNLRSLQLEGNRLTSLESDSFNGLSALQELNLAHNNLTSMNDGVLASVPNLKYLDLSYQTSGKQLLLPTSIASLTSLKILNISSTPLDQDNVWSWVSALTSLTILQLDSAGLTSINDYALRNLTQLKNLNLNNNALTSITQPMMAGPVDLTLLALMGNTIQTINRCTFYGYTLKPLVHLDLSKNPLKCDCELEWLIRDFADGKIQLSGSETCANGSPLLNNPPGSFCSQQPAPNCLPLYTTTTAPPTTTTPNPFLTIRLVNKNSTSITISWTVQNTVVQNFNVKYMELETSQVMFRGNIDKTVSQYTVKPLKPGKGYSVCVYAYTYNSSYTHTCLVTTTNTTLVPVEEESGLTSQEKGIIAGVVVGGVALIALIGAIVYMVLTMKRKKPDHKDVPTLPAQPHTFTPSELPAMSVNASRPSVGAQSRQFTRPPKDAGASGGAVNGSAIPQDKKVGTKVGRAMENIQVNVISDGRTSPRSPASRVSDGSYQYLKEKALNHDPDLAGATGGSTGAIYYDMDANSRPLPSVPNGQDSKRGYHNRGFCRDSGSESDAAPPSYNSIV